MSEPFDPQILIAPEGGLPGIPSDDAPRSLGAMVETNRQAFSGLEMLPVDEPALEGPDPVVLDDATPFPADVVPLPLELAAPDTTPPQSSTEVAALQARLATLEAMLYAQQQPAATTPTIALPATPPAPSEELMQRVAGRFADAFQAMERMADDPPADFDQQRAALFAKSIADAVYEDLLPSEAAQARFQPVAERVADARVQAGLNAQRAAEDHTTALDGIVRMAVAKAREKGYDVYAPTDPKHMASVDSQRFWALGTHVSNTQANLTPDQEVEAVFKLMPAATAAPTPAPTPTPRPQPMARQGSGPAPAASGQAEAYTPLSMNGMLHQHAAVRRIGTAA